MTLGKKKKISSESPLAAEKSVSIASGRKGSWPSSDRCLSADPGAHLSAGCPQCALWSFAQTGDIFIPGPQPMTGGSGGACPRAAEMGQSWLLRNSPGSGEIGVSHLFEKVRPVQRAALIQQFFICFSFSSFVTYHCGVDVLTIHLTVSPPRADENPTEPSLAYRLS